MLERLKAIDTAAVDELEKINEQRAVLSGRMTAMEDRKGSVSATVFARVRTDYEARHAALGEQARPFKEQVAAEYAKLSALIDELTAELDEARLSQEEVEFRHSLGEFDGDAFDHRLSEATENVNRCETNLAEANEVRARFVAAFESEDELLDNAQTAAAGDADSGSGSQGSEASFELADDGGVAPGPLDGEQPAADAAGDGEPKKRSPITAPISAPRLEIKGDDGRASEFPLQPGTTTIGRSPRNDICIREASVSRHHAKIVFTERGFVVYDLGSENGVFVNGGRVKEKLLTVGDEVEFGPGLKPYVFRGP